MPRTEPSIKSGPNGISKQHQKTTVDAQHTATSLHPQHPSRQSLYEKIMAKAQAKRRLAAPGKVNQNPLRQKQTLVKSRLTTESNEIIEAAASSRVYNYYYDYKRAEMVELAQDEDLAAWASKVNGGRRRRQIRAEKSKEGQGPAVSAGMETTTTTTTLPFRPAARLFERDCAMLID